MKDPKTHPKGEEGAALAAALCGRRETVAAKTVLIREKEPVICGGIVLRGRLTLEKTDLHGHRCILDWREAGDLFGIGENDGGLSPVTVTAACASEVLLFDPDALFRLSDRPEANTVLKTLLNAALTQSRRLTARLEDLSERTAERKVLSFLSRFPADKDGWVTVPFDRQEMADLLFLDRSALSGELGRMRRNGLLEFRKNRFRLLTAEERADPAASRQNTAGFGKNGEKT